MAKKIDSMVAHEAQWRAESDMRTLKEAEMIKADRSRMKAATAMAQKEAKALARVAGKAPRGKR